MDDKVIKVQGQLFFTYNMNHLNKNKWNEKKPDSWVYEVHLGQLDDATVNRLEKELNLKIKTKPDDKHGIGRFIRCKSKFEFRAEDMDGNAIEPEDIGNGSVAVVALRSYDHPMSEEYGWSPRIVGGKSVAHVIIKELVKREPKPEEETL